MAELRTTELLTLSIKELAKQLGISDRTIRRRVAMREMPAPKRVGGRILWVAAEIHAWVSAGMPSLDHWTWGTEN